VKREESQALMWFLGVFCYL